MNKRRLILIVPVVALLAAGGWYFFSQKSIEDITAEANEKRDNQDYAGAVELYQQVLDRDPQQTEVWFQKGVCNQMLEHYAEAENDFSKVLELNGNVLPAYTNRGFVRFMQMKWGLAIADLNITLRLTPDDTVALYRRAICNAKTAQYEAAVVDYDSLLIHRKTFAQGFLERGQIKGRLGDTTSELNDVNLALVIDPVHKNSLFERGAIRFARADYVKAYEDYNLIVTRADPNDMMSLYDRGLCLYYMKRFDEACQDIGTAYDRGLMEAKAFVDLHCRPKQ